jgi:ribosomal-protein-alanine N-acetyltransferase
MILSLFRKGGDPVIVEARASEGAALAAIHATGFERGWDALEFERLLADPTVICHAARSAGSGPPLGFAMSRQILDEAEVLTVAVAPAQRGRGIARTLMTAHLGRLAGRGVKTLFLEVADDNLAALRLYRGFGFEEVGRRSGYYARRGQAPATALIMRRPLG